MAPHKLKSTPWMYWFIRLIYKLWITVFYGTVVIENEHYIPDDGEPVIICANHSNGLTDAALLVSSVSPKKRAFLRFTAKDTLFGRRNFVSWLAENTGTLPVQRRAEHGDKVDNKGVMSKLYLALEEGDAVCIFPEGLSRFHPALAPLKTGVARIVSDVLSRNADKPDFAVTMLTCSVTYVHRQDFRSDVLVSFNPPLRLTVKNTPSLIATPDHPVVSFEAIRSLTSFMQAQLSSNMIDAPSWNVVRTAKAAARIYAPLGTRMRLGDWVRVVARFAEGFALTPMKAGEVDSKVVIERKGMRRKISWSGGDVSDCMVMKDAADPEHSTPADGSGTMHSISDRERQQLARDIKIYQDHLTALVLKDDRIRRIGKSHRVTLVWRLILRSMNTVLLLPLALPGLALWLPIFLTTDFYVRRVKNSGRPIYDTYDQVTENKLIYGLASGVLVWMVAVVITLPIFPPGFFLAIWIVPAWMWLTLRWTEDLVSAFRASTALYRMLQTGKAELARTYDTRLELQGRVMDFATHALGLPADPEKAFLVDGEGRDGGDELPSRWGKHQRGRTRGRWDDAVRYFSIRRRRKRDWNETLRWFDATEFPMDQVAL